jgi:hypothetical protein
MNIAICSRASIYNLQSTYVNPIIYCFWTRMQTSLFQRFRDLLLAVTGDGQFDSPGFSARSGSPGFLKLLQVAFNEIYILILILEQKSQTVGINAFLKLILLGDRRIRIRISN